MAGRGNTARKSSRTASPPRARPPKPPLDLVALEALRVDPESQLGRYVRAVPELGDRARRLQVVRDVEANVEAGQLKGVAERTAALKYGVGLRTVRRYVRGR